MKIDIFMAGEYVTELEDVPETLDKLSEYLGDFCAQEGFNIGTLEREGIQEAADELLAGNDVSLAGYEMKPKELLRTPKISRMPKIPTSIIPKRIMNAPMNPIMAKEPVNRVVNEIIRHMAPKGCLLPHVLGAFKFFVP